MSRREDRFFKAFQKIGDYLIDRAGSKRYRTMMDVLEKAREVDPIVRYNEAQIRDLIRLYEALSYGYYGKLAGPTDAAVVLADRLAKLMTRPPRVYPTFKRAVATIRVDDPIAEAFRVIHEDNYLLVPVVQKRKIVAVLTSEAIVRWLSAQIAQGNLGINTVSTKEVLEHVDGSETWDCISRYETLFDALDRFARHEQEGRRLSALLITHSGRPSEKLMGIITPWDLARIRSLVSAQK